MMNAAHDRRPMGLATRAVAFTVGLVLLVTLVATASVWFGAERERTRHQQTLAQNSARVWVESMRQVLTGESSAGMTSIDPTIDQVLGTRDDLRFIRVMDAQGRVLGEGAKSDADTAFATRLAEQALERRRTLIRPTGHDGALAVAMPIMHEGRMLGVTVIAWARETYRFSVLLALTPFFLFLGALLLVTIPVAIIVVHRSIAPLDTLTQFAKKIAASGQAAPIDLKTGDEFETLANAFNHMLSKLDASMRHIQQVAFVDPITQLPNQDRFQRDVDSFILQAKAPEDAGAVLVFEFQRLPKLLQTLDPEAARELVRLVAERFLNAVRTVDRLVRMRPQGEGMIAARIGAQDFAVFAANIASPADAARYAQHLNAALNQPFEWRSHKLSLAAHCGVALAPRDGRDADAVIRHARMALGAAHTAPARLKVFTQSLDREASARLMLEKEMRGAIERNEFRAYFQPKINLATGRIEACEALARWVRPDRTIVSPGRFIPVAEESGLIGPLSDAIMREACWKAAAWARAGTPAKVAVNVSALQFRSEKFAEHVLGIVRHAGLCPSQLELEITESVVMEDPDRAQRLIEPLRAAGVRLAIDDFGCGHSSLAALSKLPFDVIKIDQQFVRALERGDAQATAIVEMILALARALDLEVVAEGVERRVEAEFMAERGCHWIQGFLYGAAVSAPEFSEMLCRQAGEDVLADDAAA
ncbi:diguanylate cyclase/phosphodiesterase [alpha proteobacterium U9-1i]|nr:diguanylate cyclase/phosphodiesterase [alpha proteobacterium U9-1i]